MKYFVLLNAKYFITDFPELMVYYNGGRIFTQENNL
jgi:hypothetical protein